MVSAGSGRAPPVPFDSGLYRLPRGARSRPDAQASSGANKAALQAFLLVSAP